MCIFFLFPLFVSAQDKLFFNDGKTVVGLIVGMGKDAVFFKNSDTSALVKQIKKSDIMMIEMYNGTRYLFSESDKPHDEKKLLQESIKLKNETGMQPLAIFLGRGTFVYERLSDNGKIGFVFPFSITYSILSDKQKKNLDSAAGTALHLDGINFIGGADVNFYMGDYERVKFFVGPRFRYGTDMLLLRTEALTLQTQFGWRFWEPGTRFAQYISVGFGFAKVFSTAFGKANPDMAHTWFSINYRIGIKW